VKMFKYGSFEFSFMVESEKIDFSQLMAYDMLTGVTYMGFRGSNEDYLYFAASIPTSAIVDHHISYRNGARALYENRYPERHIVFDESAVIATHFLGDIEWSEEYLERLVR